MSSTPESLVYHFSEEAEFKTCSESSHIPRRQFNSPLFNLVTILQEESSPLVASHQIQSIRENTAFLINVSPSAVHIPLFPATQNVLTSRHFRIDQYCKTSERSQHGLSPIHYTETYESIHPESEKEFIVVHGFLNAPGILLYSEIKIYQDPERTVLSDTQFNAKEMQDLEHTLIVNLNTSRTLLDSLLQEKKKRIIDFKTQADKHEQELVTLSRTLYSQESLDQYIMVAKLLIEDITLLNQYSDIPDSRAKIMHRRLPILTARAELLKTLSIPKATTQEEDNQPEVNNDIKNVQNPTDSTLETLAKKTIHTLESQQKQLEEFFNENKNVYAPLAPNFKKISEIQQAITETEECLLLALCLPNNPSAQHKEKVDMLFKKIQTTIDEHYTQCLKVLDFGRRTANLLTIQVLFPLLETKIQEVFFEQLIDTLTTCKEGEMTERKQKLIEICDYLHHHSNIYNETLLRISKQKIYKIPTNTYEILKPFQSDDPSETLQIHPLFITYLNNNLDIFKMFLQHGIDPNSAAFQTKKNKVQCFNTIHCIATFHTEDYLEYIQTLLQYNVNPNLIYSTEQNTRIQKQKLQGGISNRKIIATLPKAQRSAVVSKTVQDIQDIYDPLLITMFRRQLFRHVDLLLPHSDINNLALLLALIALSTSFNMRRNTTEQPAFNIVQNKEAADEIFPLSPPLNFAFLTYLIFPIETTDPENIKWVEKCYHCVQNAHRVLIEKMRSPTMISSGFEVQYQQLFTQATTKNLLGKYSDAYQYFTACDFLLIERYNTLTNTQEKAQLIEQYFPELNTQLFLIIPKIYSKPHLQKHIESTQKLFSIRLKACKKWNENAHQPALTFSDKPVVTSNDAPPAQAEESTQEHKATHPQKKQNMKKS